MKKSAKLNVIHTKNTKIPDKKEKIVCSETYYHTNTHGRSNRCSLKTKTLQKKKAKNEKISLNIIV